MVHRGGVEAWNTGARSVAVRPAEFAGIDDACGEFMRVITRIRGVAVAIGEQEHWGLGEGNARLISGSTLVARLRSVAGAKENSVAAVLDAHSRIVDDIRQSFRNARDQMALADKEWAGRLRSVESFAAPHVSSVPEST